jgi:TatD DNase family protein
MSGLPSVSIRMKRTASRHVDAPKLVEAAAHPKVIGIGESGLDYYYDIRIATGSSASFRAHIEAARATGLPIIIHTRDAEEDTAAILAEEMGKGAFPALIHCFTASADFARYRAGIWGSISRSRGS